MENARNHGNASLKPTMECVDDRVMGIDNALILPRVFAPHIASVTQNEQRVASATQNEQRVAS